jgi:hypothetical protein
MRPGTVLDTVRSPPSMAAASKRCLGSPGPPQGTQKGLHVENPPARPLVTYDKDVTALLMIDPYNDFLSESGKLWGRLGAVAEANRYVLHMS